MERYESAMVDADIEDLARDPDAEALIAKWRDEGLSPEARIARLIDYYQERQLRAAE
ncbi:hypothetical protein So717_42800 [Roseobacter cerasinus]|uniref:Uncharacterized protein n=2 Tax=Roseobacter cerasinus TaxID=2602289 RepID=A0A640VX89_9RHOB|nr:hypothetical protein So717_42800 [Roseobacter cerasinus]